MAQQLTAAVLTVSDSAHQGTRGDESGPRVAAVLREHGFDIVGTHVVPDEVGEIERALIRLSSEARLVVTTGGTGIAARDVTPEATMRVCERLLPGVSEQMRAEGVKKTPRAVLSRGVCGVRGTSLVLNLPGSPKGAVESLLAVIDVLAHAVDLLGGNTEHR